MNKKGFSIVEILVVVAILGMLASLGVVTYSNLQAKARDSKLSEASKKLTEAVMLFASKTQRMPYVASSTQLSSNLRECDGNIAQGFAVNGQSGDGVVQCSIADTLIASVYLTKDFFDNLPKNTRYSRPDGKSASIYIKDMRGVASSNNQNLLSWDTALPVMGSAINGRMTSINYEEDDAQKMIIFTSKERSTDSDNEAFLDEIDKCGYDVNDIKSVVEYSKYGMRTAKCVTYNR